MYSFGISIAFCVLAGVETQPYEPHFEVAPEPYVKEGDSITFKCAVNEGPLFMFGNILHISHKSAKSGQEDTVSEQGSLVAKYKENGYELDFAFNPVCSVTITISSVTADIDGEFICQVKKSTGGETDEKVTAPVTVLVGVDRVEVTVENSVIENDGDKLAFRVGGVSVGCVAFGSNPEPVVTLMIGDEVINGDMNAILDEGSALPRRSYKGAVTAMLNFNHQMFGKKLFCKAGVAVPDGVTASFPEASSHYVILEGIVGVETQPYEPHFEVAPEPYVKEGDSITFKCAVNEGPLFMFGNILHISHKSAKSGQEDTVSEQGSLVAKYKENGYELDFAFNPVCSVTITISSVTADIDGEFICQVKKSTGGETDEKVTAPVTVLGGVDRVEMTVENSVIENDGDKLAFRVGGVSVGCVAYGSYPEPVVTLMMGDDVINGDMNAILDEGSALPRRSYKGAITAILNFNHQMFVKKLFCKAGVAVPDGVTASFPEVSSHYVILDRIVENTSGATSLAASLFVLACSVLAMMSLLESS